MSPSSRKQHSHGSKVSDGGSEPASNLAQVNTRTPSVRTYEQVILDDRLRQALALLNPTLPIEAIDSAFRKLTRPEGPTLRRATAPSTGCSSTA